MAITSCNQQSKIYNQKFFVGVLAQLVEHRNGIAGVRGSNPLGSTMNYSLGPNESSKFAPGDDQDDVPKARSRRLTPTSRVPRFLLAKSALRRTIAV